MMMRIKSLLLLLLVLTGRVAYSQHSDQQLLDSLNNRLAAAANDTNKVKLLWQIGKAIQGGNTNLSTKTTESYFRQALSLSITLNDVQFKNRSLGHLGEFCIQHSRIEEGIGYFKEAVQFHSQMKNKKAEADAWLWFAKSFNVGVDHFFVGMVNDSYFGEMMTAFINSLHLYEKLQDKEKECEVLIGIGDFLLKDGQLDSAEAKYRKVLEIQENSNIKNPQNPYSGLLVVNYFKGNFNIALLYGLSAIKTIEQAPGINNHGELYFYIGNVYRDLNQRPKAIDAYKKAIADVRNSAENNYLYAYTLKNILREYIADGKPDTAYKILRENEKLIKADNEITLMLMAENNGLVFQSLKQYPKAEAYYKTMMDLSLKLKDPVRALPSYYTVGTFYFQQKKFLKADDFLKKVYSSPKGQVPVSVLSEVYRMLYQIDSAKGNYLTALRHYGEYKTLNDQIFNEKKNKQIEELQIQYEIAKKDKDITDKDKDIQTLTKEGVLQKEKLRQKEQVQQFTFIGIILLAIISLLLYNRYRIKQKNNTRLEQKQNEINAQNEALQSLLKEKEWLLKEIHHRVKNNLQIIMSLLNSQSLYLKDDAAMMAIRDSQNRVNSMSLIHQKLYQSENLATIDMGEYISELVNHLRKSFAANSAVSFELMAEPIKLDVAQAVPVGLILNEAITNAIKYAFPDRRGKITITFKKLSEFRIELSIADNGIGLPRDFNLHQVTSLGISLMRGLAEDLDGEFVISSSGGTRISIGFNALILSNNAGRFQPGINEK